MGATTLGENAEPFVQNRNAEPIDEFEGAINSDGNVFGTYFHGLFDFAPFRTYFCSRSIRIIAAKTKETARFKQEQYDKLAAHFEKNMNVEKLLKSSLNRKLKIIMKKTAHINTAEFLKNCSKILT